ncbi:MAG TPA: hypothetical protein VGZ47_10435 [Gemmataceae bacterium]|jgi:hypothetical protein|nr:hypothetical protein [Gemmataceae bacterium]
MRSTIPALALVFVFCLVIPAHSAQIDPYVLNDGELVMSWNVQQFLETPLAKKYVRTSFEELLKSNAQFHTLLKDLELDPMKDISRVTVSGSTDPNGRGIVIVTGKFNRDKIQALAVKLVADPNSKDKLKVHKDGGLTIYEIAGEDRPTFVTFAGESTMLASRSREVLKEAVSRTSGKVGEPKKELAALIEKASDKDTLWLAALPSKDNLKSVPVGDPQQKQAVEKVTGISGTVRVDKDVNIELLFHNADMASADAVNKALQDGINLLKFFAPNLAKEKPEYASLNDIINTLHTGVKDTTVRLTGELSAASIEKSLKALKNEK